MRYDCPYVRVCLCTSTLPSSVQECCYSSSGSLINTEDGRGGQTFFYHPRLSSSHYKYDVLPKHWCCYLTDNCDLFYEVRPMDHCDGYKPLRIGLWNLQWLQIINHNVGVCCTVLMGYMHGVRNICYFLLSRKTLSAMITSYNLSK